MPAARINEVDLSAVRKMFKKAPENAINLGLGQPDLLPAQHVVEELFKAVQRGANTYGPVEGISELRAAIAERLNKYDGEINWKNVILTHGGNEGILSTGFTLFEEGDEVLTPDPGFPLYYSLIKLTGAKPVTYPLKFECGFAPDIDDIESRITSKTKGIFVNSPSNPTGGVHGDHIIDSIIELAVDNEMYIISDEVYDEMVYDAPHMTYLGKYDKLVYVNSFSKSYAIPGWRLGYVVSDLKTIKDINKFHYNAVGCPNLPCQYGALAALQGPQTSLIEMVSKFKARRDLIVSQLNKIEGVHCLSPMGAFYAFPLVDVDLTSEELSQKLLEAGLICAPGSAFGPQGEGYLRFSYVASREKIKAGISILREVVESLS